MGSGHRVHVVKFAIGTAAIVIGGSIPACEASFHEDGFRIRGDLERILLSWCGYLRCGRRFGIYRTRL
jgi:hypothetical protein